MRMIFIVRAVAVHDSCGSGYHYTSKREMLNSKRFTACTFVYGTMILPVSSKSSTMNGQTTLLSSCLNYEVWKLIWNNLKNSSNLGDIVYRNRSFNISEKTYKETIDLIGKAYTSLFEDLLCNMLNQTPDVITELCNNLGWEIQEGNYPRLILPRRPPEVKVNTESAENLLANLTDFVSFLEN